MRKPIPSYMSTMLFRGSDFYKARTENLVPLEYPEGIFKTADPSLPSVLETDKYHIFSQFDELVVSANVEFDGDGDFELEAMLNGGRWLTLGKFSTKEGQSGSAKPHKDFDFLMETDVIRVRDEKQNSAGINIRITIHGNAKIKLISFTATDIQKANELYKKFGGYCMPAYDGGPQKYIKGTLPVYAPTLPIKPISQFTQPTERAARICSPTCCSMALRYAGIDADPVKFEKITHDNTEDICGNWFLNTAGAGAAGAYAFTTRLNSIYEASELLKAGIPIAASVTIPQGKLPGFPLGKSAGHFILIKGITEKGDFVVNDPAAPSDDKAEIIYPGKKFLDAWFGQKQGLCYIITKDLSPFFRASAGMRIFDKPEECRQEVETEAMFFEPIKIIRTEKEYAYICDPEQTDNDIETGTLMPYKGWAKLRSIDFTVPLPYISMLDTPWVHLNRHSGHSYYPGYSTPVCRGTRLPLKIKGGLPPELVSPQEKTQGMNGRQIGALRKKIIANAKKYLGFYYRLGGRAARVFNIECTDETFGVDGIDCSGLAGMAYQLCGIRLPRNAHGQWLAAKPISPAELKPGDLMFLTDSENEKKIGHVMIYLGEGRLIEATISVNRVREISCEEKFGVSFAELKNGMTLPKGNKFYCGTVL